MFAFNEADWCQICLQRIILIMRFVTCRLPSVDFVPTSIFFPYELALPWWKTEESMSRHYYRQVEIFWSQSCPPSTCPPCSTGASQGKKNTLEGTVTLCTSKFEFKTPPIYKCCSVRSIFPKFLPPNDRSTVRWDSVEILKHPVVILYHIFSLSSPAKHTVL